jgi:hypothetical protein
MCGRVVLVGTNLSEERRFLQEPHGDTVQKMTFLNLIITFDFFVDAFQFCRLDSVSEMNVAN